jgi:hypothetical protein
VVRQARLLESFGESLLVSLAREIAEANTRNAPVLEDMRAM